MTSSDYAAQSKRGRVRADGRWAQAFAAKVRLIVWCKACQHQAEPNIAEQVPSYGEGMTVIDWAARLRCRACGGREVDFVVSGAKR